MLCSVVSWVGICWFILSYVVCKYVSFNNGCVCFIIGDSAGDVIDVCVVVSFMLWCPNMKLVGG